MGLIKGLFGRKHTATSAAPAQQATQPRHTGLQIGNIQGIGQRERQEDSFAILNAQNPRQQAQEGLFAIVADGMGGMADGKGASEYAVSSLCDFFPSLFQQPDPPRALGEAVHTVSDQLFRHFGGQSGSTLVAVWLLGDQLRWVSVGDSALYLMRSGGLFQLNREHNYLNELYLRELAESRIDRRRAEQDEDAHRLTAFLGINQLSLLDQNFLPLPLQAGDAILLCSDGISGILTPPELMEALSMEPGEGCTLLEQMLLEKGIPGQDNYTGIILKYD